MKITILALPSLSNFSHFTHSPNCLFLYPLLFLIC
uniref:Uncharacterized protein n=1 Tax=Wuchereria bancrofti TaxID=6293 RepID=A0AAF5PV67_WUCBA